MLQSPGTILRPLKNRDVVGFERLQVLLRFWCLRRTKDMSILDSSGKRRPLLLLPSKTLELVRVPLESSDRVLYDRLFNCASERVQEMQARSQLGQNFSQVSCHGKLCMWCPHVLHKACVEIRRYGGQHICEIQVLSLLTRLRQLCCSAGLLPANLLAELRSGKGRDSDPKIWPPRGPRARELEKQDQIVFRMSQGTCLVVTFVLDSIFSLALDYNLLWYTYWSALAGYWSASCW